MRHPEIALFFCLNAIIVQSHPLICHECETTPCKCNELENTTFSVLESYPALLELLSRWVVINPVNADIVSYAASSNTALADKIESLASTLAPAQARRRIMAIIPNCHKTVPTTKKENQKQPDNELKKLHIGSHQIPQR